MMQIRVGDVVARNPLKVLILSGTLEAGMRPVPPVADGAPEWNIYRLAEAAFADTAGALEIHILSPCEEAQSASLRDFPARAQGRYQHIVFSTRWLRFYRTYLRRLWPLSRLLRLPDLLSWVYLRRALPRIQALAPDVVMINDRPQYVYYLKRRLKRVPLWLMVRYPMGESRRFLNLLDGIIVNSAGMKKYVQGFLHSSSPRIGQIPNTLAAEFVVRPASIPADRFTGAVKTVLFVGRLVAEKGARELLLAFQQVYARLPAARLIICGDTSHPDVYLQTLYTLAAQLPSGVVTFLGSIPYQQLADHYCAADVAVFPSLPDVYIESFGMVALEAMRCATPVVAARQPGFEDLIAPGESGLLVDDPRNPAALADAILQVLQNPNLAQRMGQAGYLRSLAYTPENGLKALEEILCGSPTAKKLATEHAESIEKTL